MKETLLTYLALIRHLSSMDSNMVLLTVRTRKYLFTYFTLKRFLSSMCFQTNQALNSFSSSMDSQVLLYFIAVRKYFFAKFAFVCLYFRITLLVFLRMAIQHNLISDIAGNCLPFPVLHFR